MFSTPLKSLKDTGYNQLVVKNPRSEDVALIYPQRGFVMPARHRELRQGGRACHFSVFWNNGVMARPGAAYLDNIIIIVITLKQNIK